MGIRKHVMVMNLAACFHPVTENVDFHICLCVYSVMNQTLYRFITRFAGLLFPVEYFGLSSTITNGKPPDRYLSPASRPYS